MIVDWVCDECGKKGTAIRLDSDGKSILARVRLSHFYARRRLKFCEGKRIRFYPRQRERGQWV